ncbi:unnamed protein product [Prunus armeniaca]|uniref:Uncharacterized protein n=1 Tax=Prunus armeniaca TaxID=36596 RepID=A0A6J5V2W3_PRUAR|nr:unnamed protein product [Prunus armeniaca]
MEKREGGLRWWSWGNDGEENGWLRRLWVRVGRGGCLSVGSGFVGGWVCEGEWGGARMRGRERERETTHKIVVFKFVGCEEGWLVVVVIGEWGRRKRWFMGGGSVGYLRGGSHGGIGKGGGGIGGPRRIGVCIARERNDEEYAKELYSLVTVTEVPPEGFTSLGTKVIDEEDWTELV